VRAGAIRPPAREIGSRLLNPLRHDFPWSPGSAPGAARTIRSKANLEQVHLCLGVPAPPVASEERYCAHLLGNILGGGMSSRLFQNIREKRGLVYSIHAALYQYRDAGSLVVYAGTAPETAAEVVELSLRECARLRERLVPDRELDRAKQNTRGSIVLGLESSGSRMSNLAQQLLYHGRFYTLEEILEAVERVTARQIRDLANRIFDASCLTLTALGNREGQNLKTVAMDL